MIDLQKLFIYLDIFAFIILVSFFALLFQSSSLSRDKGKDGRI